MASPEIWRLVPSVPGVLASSRGRIMKLPSMGAMPYGGSRAYGCIARKGSWDGARYLFVHNGHSFKVARLICEAFNGPPPFPSAVCMHKDENSRHNNYDNLVWGTQKENLNAPGFLEYCKGRTGENNPYTKSRKAVA